MIRWLSIALVCLATPTWAGEDTAFNRISLSASATGEVSNDLLVAELFAQAEGQETPALADEVNRRVSWGIEQARGVAGVTVRTLDYRTQPVYRNNRVDGWSVSQAIRLESRDSQVMGDLIGRLQQRLSVRSISYSVSPEQRKTAEDQLIENAIGAFTERAEKITRAFGKTRYRIVDARVDAGGQAPGPRPYAARAMVMADAEAAPPLLESGTSDVRVEVSGTIELQP